MNLFQYSGPSCRAQSASRLEGNAPHPRTGRAGSHQKSAALRPHSAVRVFNILAHPRREIVQAGEASAKARGENQKGNRARAARAEARRRRYWPPPAHGVLDLARVGTPGDRCAGSIVHSVPGGAIGGVDSIFRRNCVSGSGSPPWHHSVYIETDRFSYLTTASPAREASLYILTKPSALQNVSQARRTIQPTPPSAPQPRSPGHL